MFTRNWQHKSNPRLLIEPRGIMLMFGLEKVLIVVSFFLLFSCDLIQRKKENASGTEKPAVARVGETFLYEDELQGIVSPGTPKEDSMARTEAYIASWIRKQLLIKQAGRQIDINKAELERKLLDYRYSLIAYEYQTYYIKQNLDTIIAPTEIDDYYKLHLDNFILKQNIVRATFIKVPKTAPRMGKVKALLFSSKQKDQDELRSYCISFAAAYHLVDSSWMHFDELCKSSPLVEIPDKIQFLKRNPYYETFDDQFVYFLKVDEYRISDNVSPLQFVSDDIANILLNKRKVDLAKQLEDEVYSKAKNNNEFEIYKK